MREFSKNVEVGLNLAGGPKKLRVYKIFRQSLRGKIRKEACGALVNGLCQNFGIILELCVLFAEFLRQPCDGYISKMRK